MIPNYLRLLTRSLTTFSPSHCPRTWFTTAPFLLQCVDSSSPPRSTIRVHIDGCCLGQGVQQADLCRTGGGVYWGPNHPLNKAISLRASPAADPVNIAATQQLDPASLEQKFVHEVYSDIADHFSSTRYSPWPSVVNFLDSQPDDALGCDLGCGNGKYLVAMADQERRCGQSLRPAALPIIATDRCEALASIVKQRGFDILVADILQLPICPNRLDFVLCVAVLHHLATEERRMGGLQAIADLLRPGGQAFIQVWAKEQHDPSTSQPTPYLKSSKMVADRRSIPSSPCDSSVTLVGGDSNQPLPIHQSGTEFKASDMLVPWRSRQSRKPSKPGANHRQKSTKDDQHSTPSDQPKPQYNRYYHLFSCGELEQLVSRINCLSISKSFYEKGNWAVIVTKV